MDSSQSGGMVVIVNNYWVRQEKVSPGFNVTLYLQGLRKPRLFYLISFSLINVSLC